MSFDDRDYYREQYRKQEKAINYNWFTRFFHYRKPQPINLLRTKPKQTHTLKYMVCALVMLSVLWYFADKLNPRFISVKEVMKNASGQRISM